MEKILSTNEGFSNNPTQKLRKRIRSEFDRICSTKTMVAKINDQLDRTFKNKDLLLLFLKYPQLPLHNNLSERDIRERVIKKKDLPFKTAQSKERAWDLILSLSSTCRKLDLSFWRYLEDRISKEKRFPTSVSSLNHFDENRILSSYLSAVKVFDGLIIFSKFYSQD